MSDAVAVSTPWARLPADLAGALGARLEPTVAAVARHVSGSVPAFAQIDDPKFERDVDTAVRAAVARFVDLVGTDQAALPPGARESFVALGAAEAREERGSDVLLAALRAAGRTLLREASRSLATLGPLQGDEVLDLADAVTAFVDELVAASTEGYALQLREQASETDRRRRLLGEALVRGNTTEGFVLAAAADIGWRGLGAVVPVLLPSEHARDARFRYGADGIVLDREQDAVLLVREGRRSGRAHLTETLHGRGATVGLALGHHRVPESLRMAELTAQLVGVAGDDPVFAVDHLAQLAVRGERGAIEALTELRLAPFSGLPAHTRRRLLQTLHSWLRHWGSRADVASELFIHPQTVSYRLRRLRELLGDDLDDDLARFELMLVLADVDGGSATSRPGSAGR